jgi:peptide/nickel transport system substrate-binding protein
VPVTFLGYSVSADGLTWTFDIRSDAKFTDGRPVTAEDVAFTFNTAKEANSEIDLTRMKLPRGVSWDDIYKEMYQTPVVFGWGSHSPMEVYNLYHSIPAPTDFNNLTNTNNPAVNSYMDAALSASNTEDANSAWRKAAWDGTTGYANQGDATWCWIVNIEHLYYVRDGLDTGNQRIHPHGHGFPVISNIKEWKLK